jgi:hypothetical protein
MRESKGRLRAGVCIESLPVGLTGHAAHHVAHVQSGLGPRGPLLSSLRLMGAGEGRRAEGKGNEDRTRNENREWGKQRRERERDCVCACVC